MEHLSRNKRPLDTYQIVDVIGPTQFSEVYNEGNSQVVQSSIDIRRVTGLVVQMS